MSFKFLQIPARGCEQTESELNSFLNSHRVLSVDRRWVDVGENSFWSICIDYLEKAGKDSYRQSAGGQKNRIDYKEILSPDEFVMFSALRELRKTLATENAVPVYSIMTNEQLAQVVQRKVSDHRGLLKIPGLGESKVEKYGARVLELMKSLESGGHETDRESI